MIAFCIHHKNKKVSDSVVISHMKTKAIQEFKDMYVYEFDFKLSDYRCTKVEINVFEEEPKKKNTVNERMATFLRKPKEVL